MSTWAQLLANFAVVAMFVSVWIQTHVWADRLGSRASSAAFGLLMGVGVMALMNIPVQLMPGVNVDLRFAMIGTGGLFRRPHCRPHHRFHGRPASASTRVASAPMPARCRSSQR